MKNRTTLLNHMFRSGPMSKATLASRAGLSNVTVNAITNELLETQLLVEVGKTGGSAGRPAGILDFHPLLGTMVGVDVLPLSLTVLTADLRGNNRFQRTITVESPNEVNASLEQLIDDLIQAAPHGPVRQIALAVPAPVNPMTLQLLEPNSLLELDLPRIIEYCAGRGLTLLADNDANLAALAERAYGSAAGHSNFGMLIHRESGIGLGLVLDDRLFLGHDGQAGELALAHWPLAGRPVPIEQLPLREQEIATAYLVSGCAIALNLSRLVVYQARPAPDSDLLRLLRRLLSPRIPVSESQVGADGPVLGALSTAVSFHAEGLFSNPTLPTRDPTPHS